MRAPGRWPWLVGGGCLGIVAVASCCLFSVLWMVFGILRASEPYERAMTMAQADERVAQALGEPVRASWYLSGNIAIENGTGHAELSIPLYGPDARGTLEVVATLAADRWIIEEAVLTIPATSQTIDLRRQGEQQE